MTKSSRYLSIALGGLMVFPLWLNTGCANRGIGPQGGPKDTVPPVIVKRTLEDGARRVTVKEQEIQFDEFIQIDGSTENILVSPPQQRPPEIKAVGKKLEIRFKEDLKDSTTYTIDFGDQIVDNNEKNPLKNFSLSFSTGDQIDSLEIYGQLINAEDLNPVSGVVVGIHELMDDTAFYRVPFTRIARTNTEGEFNIRNVKAGTYRLYALQDQSRDYCFQPGEALAFSDSLITPYITTEILQDTIYLQDTISADGQPIPDSIYTREYCFFEPSNLVLRLFTEDYQRLYFKRMMRNDAHLIQLFFNGSQPELPQLTALRLERDSLETDSAWVDFTQHSLMQHTAGMDTFRIWLSDSMAIRMDSIRFAMTYFKSDSLFQPIYQTDTIMAAWRAPRLTERAQQTIAQKRLKEGLVLKSNAGNSFNFFDTLFIQSPSPLREYAAEGIHLTMKEDTTMKTVPCHIVPYDSLNMNLAIIARLKPNQDYELRVDSGAMKDIYSLTNNESVFKLHVRSEEEYATITVFVEPYDERACIQLLNNNDKPVVTAKAQENGTKFTYMEAGTYYLRIFMDENADGKWTTGDFKSHRQPEAVYYFQKKLNLKANWTFEQLFNWQMIPVLDQKPADIRKDATTKK